MLVVLLLRLLMSGHQYLSSSSLECARAKTRTRSWMRTLFRTRRFHNPLQCLPGLSSHLSSAHLVSFLDLMLIACGKLPVWPPKVFLFWFLFFCVSGRTAFTEWAQGLARLIKRPEIHTFAHLANLRLCSTVAPAVYLSLPAHARTAIIIIVELWSDLSKVRSQCKLANKNLYISILFVDHLHLRWWEELLNRMTCFEQRDKSQLTRQCHTKNGKYSTENVF